MPIFFTRFSFYLCIYFVFGANCQLKTFTIDLDEKPSNRFLQPTIEFKSQLVQFINSQRKLVDLKALLLIESIAAQVDKLLPYPYNEEIKGISYASGIDLGDVVLSNLIYDITTFCTSIVAQREDGCILHGRNLDYNYKDYLANLTYIAKFTKNGTLLYTTLQPAGFIGVLTAHKYKSFTFSINERDQGYWWLNVLFAILDRRAQPLSILTRNLMENARSFQDALNILTKNDMIAPAYFILGGINEGAVITRNQSDAVDVWVLNKTSTSFDRWFLIETNYDHFTPPPPNDDRRDPAIDAMNKITQSRIDDETLLDVLSIEPINNKATIYSVVMSAANKEAFLRISLR